MMGSRWVAWGALAFATGCVEPARPPVLPSGGNDQARQGFYDQYQLTADVGFFSATWKRSDGSYNWGQLEQVAEQFPESSDVYGRATTRGIVLSSISAAGGALIGYTLGYNLSARADQRWSSETQAAFYGTGGGLIVVAVVMALAWHNPADDFADTYNRALRRRLDLPEAPGKTVYRLSPWVPRPVGLGEAGWTF